MAPGPGTIAPPNTPYPSRPPTAQSLLAPPNSPEPMHVKPGDRPSKNTEPFPPFDPEQKEHNSSIGANPVSPFYSHETSTPAAFAARTGLRQDLHDPEKGIPHGHALKRRGHSGLCDEKERGCACWQRLDKKKRLALEMLIAVVIVGTMIGIALGITAAVGGGIWKSSDQRKRLGE